jgi:hypothetical protein
MRNLIGYYRFNAHAAFAFYADDLTVATPDSGRLNPYRLFC